MMYQVHDVVLYKGTGVCEVTALTEKRLGEQMQECYALVPCYVNNLTIFVPHALEYRMRPVRSETDILASLQELSTLENIWISDVHMRRKKYRHILLEGTEQQFLQVLKTLYFAKQRRQFRGQKGTLCVSDEHLLHDCKRILAEELASATGRFFPEAEQQISDLLQTVMQPAMQEAT
jgi:RNA polymerase-interacting CarD/CdnL/TRCF family regulator